MVSPACAAAIASARVAYPFSPIFATFAVVHSPSAHAAVVRPMAMTSARIVANNFFINTLLLFLAFFGYFVISLYKYIL